MTRILSIVLAVLIPLAIGADEASSADGGAMIRSAGDSDLSEFLWIKRPIIVFADSPADPRFAEQIERLKDGMEMLADRDVVILTDSDPALRSPIRVKLRPRGFMLVLIGKDGQVKLRKPLPWTVREITRSIDKSSERQREVEERRPGG